MNQSDPSIFPCPRCNLLIKQGGHWDIFHCLRDLKRQVEKQNKFLVALVGNRTKRSKIKWLAEKADFLSDNLIDLIKHDNGKLDDIYLFTKELVRILNDLKKETGL